MSFFAHDDPWLVSHYRLPRNVLLDLCTDVAPNLERKKHYNHASVTVQVLSTLGFLATWTFRKEMSDRSGITEPSFSRITPSIKAVFVRHVPSILN